MTIKNDIDRNLKEPLKEIDELAISRGNDFPKIRVDNHILYALKVLPELRRSEGQGKGFGCRYEDMRGFVIILASMFIIYIC